MPGRVWEGWRSHCAAPQTPARKWQTAGEREQEGHRQAESNAVGPTCIFVSKVVIAQKIANTVKMLALKTEGTG